MIYRPLDLPGNGPELIQKANDILGEFAATSGIPPVTDVGLAGIVYALYRYGFAAERLDWRPYVDRWHYVPPGAEGASSSFPGAYDPGPALFLVHSDGQAVDVSWDPCLTLEETILLLKREKLTGRKALTVEALRQSLKRAEPPVQWDRSGGRGRGRQVRVCLLETLRALGVLAPRSP